MFSQQLPAIQVAVGLPQVSAVFSNLRQGFSSTSFLKTNPKSSHAETSELAKAGSGNLKKSNKRSKRIYSKKKASSVEECITVLLKEENLSRILPLQVTIPVSELEENIWSTSYISADTFYENRTGFPEKTLEETDRGTVKLFGFPTKPLLSARPPVFQQKRTYIQDVKGFGGKKKPQKEEAQVSPQGLQYLKNSFEDIVKQNKGNIHINIQGSSSPYLTSVKNNAWRIFVAVVIIYCISSVMRNMRGMDDPGANPLNLFDTPEYTVENVSVTFNDVRGVDEAKQELEEAVEFLKHPEKFEAIGAKLPKGVLLVGPPGVGKTLLAKAVAGEAGVPFLHAAGAQFDDIYVGSGARRVRKLFAKAKASAPCVVFIDEIDSAGAKRTSSSIHPYANQTINQLLSEMDGFNSSTGITVIGATNKKGNLDEALLRPGRFDVEVGVRAPDTKGREEIFGLYLDRVKYDPNISMKRLGKISAGMTGADISNVVNQAAIRAALKGRKLVQWEDLDYAMDKSRMGPAWKNKRMQKKALEKTAYHEAGHTIVTLYTKEAPELNKVTILPRGKSLGFTSYLPESDVYSQSKIQMIALIDIAMGGRVAEELKYGQDHVTSGASSDFQQATRIATNMVKQFGMSEKVGFRTHTGSRDVIQVNETSPDYQKVIDSEIEKILKESYDRVKVILTARRNELENLAESLLKYGTLEKEEVRKVLKGQKINREPDVILKDRNISES